MESADLDLAESQEMVLGLAKALGMGASLAELHGVTPDTLEGIYAYAYAYAYDFYEKGRLDEAELFFKFLCIYDFQNYNYLKGYAAVCQLKKQYQKAYDIYNVCLILCPNDDFSTVYYMGQCQMGLNNIAIAIECFKSVVEYSSNEKIKGMASTWLELLDMHKKEATGNKESTE
ncbi:tetratricopeptide repeat protein [Escherichia albertii]|uniref:tetratricopeptide repeat protein n=1 Tax=Escherichia albertii TaxID=208962 RepID=UPI0019178997|nr:tetratricopeptide repeat protein [Escherichia albertii]EHK6580705.1 tetratricopeptide repeat protein [Escherichia albertii]KAF0952027.1 CesD/SycD/LcrH family type III secretion system chaperone [Escherichia albertii]MCU7300012.1 tetratricopeptide repeat protein [Escherichia albertii]MCZ8929241.1 tetratricopeptide repeat protein [Escherichia albertii]MCZ8986633.1 tetratricopeptide repeat protein [Escherichia albertii]